MASPNDLRAGGPKSAATVGGYAFSAVLGTAAPTDAATALNAAYKDLGYVSKKGVAVSPDAKWERETDWNLDTVMVIPGDKSCTVKLSLLSVSAQTTLEEVFGVGNVTVTGQKVAYGWSGDQLPHKMYAFDMKYGATARRLAINDGQVTKVGDIEHVKNSMEEFAIEIECFKDSTGLYFHKYEG